MVRAKFVVRNISDGTYDGQPAKSITLYPVFTSVAGKEGNATEENKIFGKYTPNGNLSMTIVNPDAYNQFELNEEFYVDLNRAA